MLEVNDYTVAEGQPNLNTPISGKRMSKRNLVLGVDDRPLQVTEASRVFPTIINLLSSDFNFKI